MQNLIIKQTYHAVLKKASQVLLPLNIPDTTILEYTNYLLLNACAVEDTGFALGKAGISLALFEVADLLKQKNLKEKATRLLEECILLTPQTLSFKTGWAGIIYVVRYLQHRGLLEIEFEEIFHEHEVALLSSIKNLIQQGEKENLLEAVSLAIPFADGHHPEGEMLLKMAVEKCLQRYSQLWKEIAEGNPQTFLKVSLIQKEFCHLIYMLCLCRLPASTPHFTYYIKACNEGYIAMSTLERCRFDFFRKRLRNNSISITEVLPQLTDLRDLISLWVHCGSNSEQILSAIEPLLTKDLKKREENFSLLTTNSPKFSFENGNTRFLLFLCSERQQANIKKTIQTLLV